MEAYRYQTTVEQGGKVMLDKLPLQTGIAVEVIILVQAPNNQQRKRYPLHGTPIIYIDPTEPVADIEWEALP